jgi:hypothetical protein
MVSPVDLSAKRKEKEPKCDWCGAAEHATTFLCPRVAAITYEGDCVTVELWPLDWPADEPPKGAA